MDEDFLNDCEAAVKRLFKGELLRAASVGEKFGLVPYLDDLFAVENKSLFPQIEREVCRALVAREEFRWRTPPWIRVVELPLSGADIEKAIRSKDNRIAIIGY